MSLFPGGDAYFGALLNSFIHVMMYGYYALALLKIRCPWKKYLTQAQLLQFTLVVIYSFFSGFMWPKEERQPKHYLCLVIQVWEMASLFALFSFFYMKAYGRKKQNKAGAGAAISSSPSSVANKEDDDDQCQAAVKAAIASAAQAVESATKDAERIASTANMTRRGMTNVVPPIS